MPDTVDISEKEFEFYWQAWTYWVATERKFLPSQILNEPERPLMVFLEIDNLYEKIRKQLLKERNDG